MSSVSLAGDRRLGGTATAPSMEFVARRPSSARPAPKPAILALPLLPLLEQELAKSPWSRVHTAGHLLAMDLARMELPGHTTPRPGLANSSAYQHRQQAASPRLLHASAATTCSVFSFVS